MSASNVAMITALICAALEATQPGIGSVMVAAACTIWILGEEHIKDRDDER